MSMYRKNLKRERRWEMKILKKCYMCSAFMCLYLYMQEYLAYTFSL
jgi:hypothetical protein